MTDQDPPDVDAVVLDVDGTVLRGEQAIPGAPAAVRWFRDAGLDCLFVTNNPTRPPTAFAERLSAAGVPATPDDVLTSGEMTAEYLARDHPDRPTFVVGEDGLREQLRAHDVVLTGRWDAAEVVVASVDREFTYDDLTEAFWALEDDDVAFVATDPDLVVPGGERDVPGSGAIVGAVANVAGRDPEAVLGKPSPGARAVILDRIGVPPERCLVVGDRLDTDVALGADAGMTTALVLSGVTGRQDVAASDHRPDFVADSLAAIPEILGLGDA
ncbi:HAD-IIA family hydrolase [Haloarchaeobius sp. HRN-SO-5]|uniref:HAD-IIA family hydrolase n=1 Tax=Haloarchaeobius sp. HRN-SO-5 TaxID=3446118 RepID=UPI003EB9654D